MANSYYHGHVVPSPESAPLRWSMVTQAAFVGRRSTQRDAYPVEPLVFSTHDTSRTSSFTSREPEPFGHRSREHRSERDPTQVPQSLLHLPAAQGRRVVRAFRRRLDGRQCSFATPPES